eukprot:CAMPEP_0204903426 /NCGR_PEP_ID=MMETSP1397-20131031/4247_1 /ASSEMBLY_ACC=CAM_ASM_000891 /TAXON_ID=49980 /ORGANISM="Climacostomum Climacostomum virens, Strain Stock W-24" /LENGTH=141 /DNA_ID=CAMNT_0052072057 /DNA_START=99 /DNA_END=521 /DNA_ORIENTATION=-
MATILKKLLYALPIPLVIHEDFLTLARVRDDSMQPTLNPSFPNTSGFEDDIVLVKRVSDSTDFEQLKGKIVLIRSNQDPSQKLFRRLEGVQGNFVKTSEFSRRFIPSGQCWVLSSGTASDSRDFGPVPLGLILGEVTHIVW